MAGFFHDEFHSAESAANYLQCGTCNQSTAGAYNQLFSLLNHNGTDGQALLYDGKEEAGRQLGTPGRKDG